MDSNRLDLLAQETFNLSMHLDGKLNHSNFDEAYDRYAFKNNNDSEKLSEVEEFEGDEAYEVPALPGVLFKLERSNGTFCVRGFASEDLNYDYEMLLDGNNDILKCLRLEASDVEAETLHQNIFYFITENICHAEVICDQIINRRFPLEEDILCNLSDPGFSWWLETGEKEFTIYYKSHGLDRANRFIKLGPLGDPLLAKRRFQQLYPWFKHNMALADFTCTEKIFQIRVSEQNRGTFENFKNILAQGRFGFDRSTLPLGGRGTTLFCYLAELSVLRAFWLEVESRLQ